MVLPVLLAVPALANPTVTSPDHGSTVSSPFTLTAKAARCSNQEVVAMGYSLDSSAHTEIVRDTYLEKHVAAPQGGHTIHVKAWGGNGAVCVTDVPVTVEAHSPSHGPDVSAPRHGSTVKSPFNLSASMPNCSGQPVVSIGYSLDDSVGDQTVQGTVLKTMVSTGTGGHTVHVKAWASKGVVCTTSVAVIVSGTSSTVPAHAVSVSNLQASGRWKHDHDAGTPGKSSGTMELAKSPSRSGHARHLATSYVNYGGERYSTSFSDKSGAHNFVYDAWVYIAESNKNIKVLEMDLNQVIGNGWTVIMGFQCDGWSKTWDYTANLGTAAKPKDKWLHSSSKCDPKKWAANAWHHVQIEYSRADSGHVTYKSVALDDQKQSLNVKVFSAFDLGWRGDTILTNFQVDGATKGKAKSDIFLDGLNVSYW